MNDPAYTVECARIQDIPAMLNMEKTYFDSYWHSESTLIQKLIEQEPMMFRVCKADDKVKGFYWVFPLEHSIWHKVITGKMDEGAIVNHIKSFDEPNLHLYISSVIVDQTDKLRKKYTKALVYDFGRNFVFRKNKYAPDIRAVGAITISEGGRRLMEKSKFIYKGSFKSAGELVRSYAINHESLLKQAISIRQNLRVKSIA